ncbi:hypothetical protein CYMTET_19421, partial [Cymbomonas tetramitiformis]
MSTYRKHSKFGLILQLLFFTSARTLEERISERRRLQGDSCVDVSNYQDEVYSCSCSCWGGIDCETTLPLYGYTEEQTADVIENCPATCGACPPPSPEPPPQPQPPPIPPVSPPFTVSITNATTASEELSNAIGNVAVYAIYLNTSFNLTWALPKLTRSLLIEGTCATEETMCVIDAHGSQGFFTVGDGGNLTVREMALRNGQAEYGAALYLAEGAAAQVVDCELTGHHASVAGGSVYAASGAVTITGCTLAGNSATSHGGVLYATDTITVVITDTLFEENQAEENGGVLAVGGIGTVAVTGIHAVSCSAGGSGGVFYLSGSAGSLQLWAEGSLFENCSAATYGGVLSAEVPEDEVQVIVELINVQALSNRASCAG